jgi:spore coat polysaccharide biosynthesis protein SpsF
MEALNRVPAELRVLACTEDSIAAFSPLAAEAGFELLAGPKDDVLGRYCLALKKFGIQQLIRATGDNPFVFADAAASINAEAMALGADYAGYGGLPFGAGVEAVSAVALFRAESEVVSEYEREHVCPYLYGHPKSFSFTGLLRRCAGRAGTCGLPLTLRKIMSGRSRCMPNLIGWKTRAPYPAGSVTGGEP